MLVLFITLMIELLIIQKMKSEDSILLVRAFVIIIAFINIVVSLYSTISEVLINLFTLNFDGGGTLIRLSVNLTISIMIILFICNIYYKGEQMKELGDHIQKNKDYTEYKDYKFINIFKFHSEILSGLCLMMIMFNLFYIKLNLESVIVFLIIIIINFYVFIHISIISDAIIRGPVKSDFGVYFIKNILPILTFIIVVLLYISN